MKQEKPKCRRSSFAAFIAGFFALGPWSSAHAHLLEAQAVLRPGWRVQVESWYETGESAAGARVQVFGTEDRLRAEGRLDPQGIFIFSYQTIESLRIVVNAGAGHRVEVRLPDTTLARHAVCTAAACLPPTPTPWLAAPLLVPIESGTAAVPLPMVDRRSGTPWARLLLGVSGLFGLALLTLLAGRWRQGRATAGKD